MMIKMDMIRNTYIEHTSEYDNICNNMIYKWNEEVVNAFVFGLDNKCQQYIGWLIYKTEYFLMNNQLNNRDTS